MVMSHPVALEIGRRRVFAAASAWSGWCRSSRTEDTALEALAAWHALDHAWEIEDRRTAAGSP